MGRTFRTRLLIHLLTFTVTFINTIAGEVRRGMSLLDFRGGGGGNPPICHSAWSSAVCILGAANNNNP